MTKLLLVEDDPQISKSLKINLTYAGYEVATAENFAEAWSKISAHPFDIFLFDVNLPDGDGLELCHQVRAAGKETPVLFLSARTDEETVVKAMNIGGEDYIRKPFGIEELKVRMAKAMKRALPARKTLEEGPLALDLGRRSAQLAGKSLNLGRREFDILSVLMKKAGDVVTREHILEQLEGNTDLFDRTIDSHVSHLRRKLKDVGGDSVQILSVYGVGYRLEFPQKASS